MTTWRHYARQGYNPTDLFVCYARFALCCRDAHDPRWDELVLRLVAATLLPAPEVIRRIERMAG